MTAAFPAFRPRAPWFTSDLQTLRNWIRRPRISLARWPARRLELPMRDGSGDRLVGEWHEGPGPLVLLLHGLTGCAASHYMQASAASLLERGYSVVRLNLRGAAPSAGLCRRHYHAGRSDGLRDALASLPSAASRGGLAAMGFSLGANLLLKFLGEEGVGCPLAAAVAVSAPIDLAASSRRLMAPRNAVYQRYLLRRMQAEGLRANAELSAVQRAAGWAARSVLAYDEGVVAPVNGFAGAQEYYARCSAGRFLAAIATPTLVIHALDDPWIPSDAYSGRDWAATPRLTVLLPPAGGHVGFHGGGSPVPWHDRCAARFLDRVFER